MRKIIVIVFLLAAIQTVSAGTIVVTISDFKPIVEAVAGEDFEVIALLPQGSDPHEFSLSVDDLDKLRKADLIVLANSHFFEFEAKISREFSNLVDFDDYGVKLYDFPGYPSNLHGYWMLPENGIRIARAVMEKLAEKYPEKKEQFERNYEIFVSRVKEAVKEAGRIAADERGKRYVAMVPGVCYIAKSLNITVSAIVISEGSGIASTKELLEIKRKLENGEYAGVIAPEFMKYGKGGELAKELLKGTEAKMAWVKFSQGDSAYDTMIISNAARIAYSSGSCERSDHALLYILATLCVLEAILIVYLRVRE